MNKCESYKLPSLKNNKTKQNKKKQTNPEQTSKIKKRVWNAFFYLFRQLKKFMTESKFEYFYFNAKKCIKSDSQYGCCTITDSSFYRNYYYNCGDYIRKKEKTKTIT